MNGPSPIAALGSLAETAPARATTNEGGPQNAAWSIALVQAGAAPPVADKNAPGLLAKSHTHIPAHPEILVTGHQVASRTSHPHAAPMPKPEPAIASSGTNGSPAQLFMPAQHHQPVSVIAPIAFLAADHTAPATIPPPSDNLFMGTDPASHQSPELTMAQPGPAARRPLPAPDPKSPSPPAAPRPVPQQALVSAPVLAPLPADPATINPTRHAATPGQNHAPPHIRLETAAASITTTAGSFANFANKVAPKPSNENAATASPAAMPPAPTPALALAAVLPSGRAVNAQPTPVAITAPMAPTTALVPATPSGLAAAVSAMHRNGENSAVLRLDPPGLGNLSVHIGFGQDASINVMFVPATAQAAQLLHAGMEGLRQAMTSAGLNLGQAGIDSGQRDRRQQPQQQSSPTPQNVSLTEQPHFDVSGIRATA